MPRKIVTGSLKVKLGNALEHRLTGIRAEIVGSMFNDYAEVCINASVLGPLPEIATSMQAGEKIWLTTDQLEREWDII